MFLHKFDSVHTIFLTNVIDVSGVKRATKSGIQFSLRTKSLALDPSPAIFPKAQTACSATFEAGDFKSSTNLGIPPFAITTCVCSDVPEATFVNAQHASNWRRGLKDYNLFCSIKNLKRKRNCDLN